MKISAGLLRDTALYIKEYYDTHFPDQYCFHNYERVVNIVRTCDVLAVRSGVDPEISGLAHLAAWFSETGYCKDFHNAELRSAELARIYLSGKGLGEDAIRQVEDMILASRQPPQPVSIAAQVLCDARTYHLADKHIMAGMGSLRKEYARVLQQEFTDEEWKTHMVKVVMDHYYFTEAARNLFQKKKKKILAGFQEFSEIPLDPADEKNLPGEAGGIPGAAREEPFKAERGVETFFRVSQRRQMDLSKNAHDKSSLLISINTIVISIVLSVLFTRLDINRFLIIPTLLMVLTCSLTITFAVIATRPRLINRGSKYRAQKDEDVNLLYFKDAARLSMEEFRILTRKTYRNSQDLYDSLSRDIYYQSLILERKFHFLAIAYAIFLYGFMISIASFIVAFAFHTQPPMIS